MGTGITNFVSMDIMANLLLAAGASPAMVRLTSHCNKFPAYQPSIWTPHSPACSVLPISPVAQSRRPGASHQSSTLLAHQLEYRHPWALAFEVAAVSGEPAWPTAPVARTEQPEGTACTAGTRQLVMGICWPCLRAIDTSAPEKSGALQAYSCEEAAEVLKPALSALCQVN